jgi:hypothetical protein
LKITKQELAKIVAEETMGYFREGRLISKGLVQDLITQMNSMAGTLNKFDPSSIDPTAAEELIAAQSALNSSLEGAFGEVAVATVTQPKPSTLGEMCGDPPPMQAEPMSTQALTVVPVAPEMNISDADLVDLSPASAFGYAWETAIEQLRAEFPEAAAKLETLAGGPTAMGAQALPPEEINEQFIITYTKQKRIIILETHIAYQLSKLRKQRILEEGGEAVIDGAARAGDLVATGIKGLAAFLKPILGAAIDVAIASGKWGIEMIPSALRHVGKFLGGTASGLHGGILATISSIKTEKEWRSLAADKPEEFLLLYNEYSKRFKDAGLTVTTPKEAAGLVGVGETKGEAYDVLEDAAGLANMSVEELQSQLNVFGLLLQHVDAARKADATRQLNKDIDVDVVDQDIE